MVLSDWSDGIVLTLPEGDKNERLVREPSLSRLF